MKMNSLISSSSKHSIRTCQLSYQTEREKKNDFDIWFFSHCVKFAVKEISSSRTILYVWHQKGSVQKASLRYTKVFKRYSSIHKIKIIIRSSPVSNLLILWCNPHSENNFQESACFEVLELMRECCRSLRKDQKSICCEGISLDPVDPANKSQSKKKYE